MLRFPFLLPVAYPWSVAAGAAAEIVDVYTQ